MIVDFLWGGPAPYAMNHANVGARYIQVGSSAGPTSTIAAATIRNKLLTLVGQGTVGTPAEVRRSAYAQLMRHAADGKFTLDLEHTRLDDISQTWSTSRPGHHANLWSHPETPDLEQFQAERLDLGQHAMQRGLVRGASQHRVVASRLGLQGGERAQRRRTQVAADADLVARRWQPVALPAGHRLTSVSGARAVAVLARENRHRAARRTENASTAGKVPVNPDSTPTPTTGMIRPA